MGKLKGIEELFEGRHFATSTAKSSSCAYAGTFGSS